MTDYITLFAAHAEHTFAQVAAGEVDNHVALAVLASEALATSIDDQVPFDQAVALRGMAEQWSVQRMRAMHAEAILRREGVPDDIGGLE